MEKDINMVEKNEKKLFDEYCEKIREKYGVSFGNLYFRGNPFETTKIEFYHSTYAERDNHESFHYNKGNGDIHMFPQSMEIAKFCADFIKSIREKIKKQIEKLIESGDKKYEDITPAWGKWNNGKDAGNSTSAFDGTDYKSVESLFFYLRVKYKCKTEDATNYDLVFNRFFFDNDNRVNCILLCFQIEMYDRSQSDSEMTQSKRRKEPPKTKNYPKTPLAKGCGKDEKGSMVYYNFSEADIFSPAEKIAKEFLEFILRE